MYIGGISYFSSGSEKRPLGGVCPEAVASPDSKTKQMKTRVIDTIKHLKLKKGDRISERTRGVHHIFSTQTGYGRPGQLAETFGVNCESNRELRE